MRVFLFGGGYSVPVLFCINVARKEPHDKLWVYLLQSIK